TGRIDLKHIDVLTCGDALAGRALITGCGGRSLLAVEALGQDTSGRGLADATGAGEQVGMSNAVALNGVLESASDVFLSNQFSKALRSIAARQDRVSLRHWGFLSSGRGLVLGHELWLFSSGQLIGAASGAAHPRQGSLFATGHCLPATDH